MLCLYREYICKLESGRFYAVRNTVDVVITLSEFAFWVKLHLTILNVWQLTGGWYHNDTLRAGILTYNVLKL